MNGEFKPSRAQAVECRGADHHRGQIEALVRKSCGIHSGQGVIDGAAVEALGGQQGRHDVSHGGEVGSDIGSVSYLIECCVDRVEHGGGMVAPGRGVHPDDGAQSFEQRAVVEGGHIHLRDATTCSEIDELIWNRGDGGHCIAGENRLNRAAEVGLERVLQPGECPHIWGDDPIG